ncbi:hypothetical protein GA0115240_142511 [Streptomyces sp. DvalAA-14]|nr:hypothetical protein GA0115240_142511 [Streptomyces sp. DvalAA-14]
MYAFARGGFVEHNDGGGPRHRRGRLIAAAAGLVALVALTAGAVIAFGPSPSGHADAAPAVPPTTAHTSAATAPSATGAPAPVTAAPTARPTARATGHVKNGVHTGDLRYFLLAPPRAADVYGDAAGSALTVDDIAAGASDPSEARRDLKTYGFRNGVYRTYLTADGVSEVTVKLVRFAGPSQAAAFYAEHYYNGTKISLGEDFPARGYRLASGSAESTDTVLAISYQGDVDITLTVTGGKAPSRALLKSLLDAQHQRLMSGR